MASPSLEDRRWLTGAASLEEEEEIEGGKNEQEQERKAGQGEQNEHQNGHSINLAAKHNHRSATWRKLGKEKLSASCACCEQLLAAFNSAIPRFYSNATESSVAPAALPMGFPMGAGHSVRLCIAEQSKGKQSKAKQSKALQCIFPLHFRIAFLCSPQTVIGPKQRGKAQAQCARA